MVEKKKKEPNKIKELAFRVAKATAKAILFYLIYFVLAPFLAMFASVVPEISEIVELFVGVSIVLMILSDLTANTIYQCFLNAGRAIFTIAFLVFALGDGVFNVNYQGFSLTLNLTTVYGILALLSLLGLAKSVMQGINFMSERAESGVKP
jgi:uncharacterized ion transporter superfamily protein YfcC